MSNAHSSRVTRPVFERSAAGETATGQLGSGGKGRCARTRRIQLGASGDEEQVETKHVLEPIGYGTK